jgi:putative membrane protein
VTFTQNGGDNQIIQFFKNENMKKIVNLFVLMCSILLACNNEGTKSETSDSSSTNKSDHKMGDSSTSGGEQNSTKQTDQATVEFLNKAADGGMAEVAAGEMAQQKATDAGVKRFASMMVHDHSGANGQIKSLSSARNVNLPAEPSPEHKQKAAETEKKSGKAFDKAYMDMMVEDHKKTIALFEKASGESSDDEVKNFITATLPKLKMHLDSATAIRKSLR